MRLIALEIRSAMDRHFQGRRWLFLGIVAASVPLYWTAWVELTNLALRQESYSHILVVPALSAWLLWLRRDQLRASPGPSSNLAGGVLLAVGTCVYVAAWIMPSGARLSLSMLSLVLIWIGGFFLAFGTGAARTGIFALACLLFLVPPPDLVLQFLIGWLQHASAEVTHWVFQFVGIPVYRDGLIFRLPNLTIELARECSGIRSSICLLLTTLVAAHLFLRLNVSKFALVACVIPIAVLKNGLRIVSLSMLSTYVHPGFINGALHREGGILFFILAVAEILLVLRVLQLLEARHNRSKRHLERSKRQLEVSIAHASGLN